VGGVSYVQILRKHQKQMLLQFLAKIYKPRFIPEKAVAIVLGIWEVVKVLFI
jgi:hypothetical protein